MRGYLPTGSRCCNRSWGNSIHSIPHPTATTSHCQCQRASKSMAVPPVPWAQRPSRQPKPVHQSKSKERFCGSLVSPYGPKSCYWSRGRRTLASVNNVGKNVREKQGLCQENVWRDLSSQLLRLLRTRDRHFSWGPAVSFEPASLPCLNRCARRRTYPFLPLRPPSVRVFSFS